MSRRAKTLVLAIAVLGTGLLLLRVRGVLTPFFLGAAIAYMSYPLVVRLERKQVPRVVAILLVYAIFAVFATILAYAILPSLSRELDQIVANLPEQSRRAEGLVGDAMNRLRRIWLPEGMQEVANLSLRRAEELLERFAARLAEYLIVMVSHVFHLILAPFLAYYILRDFEHMSRRLTAWLPTKAQRDALELAGRVNRVVGGFLRGQVIVSVVVAVMTGGLLALLGVRYALLLGVIAGVANIIPYFGPILSGIPAVAFALLESPTTALWVLVALVGVQQFESSILSPKLVGERVGLHPLTVIFAVLAGGELAGVLGILLAVPAAATLKEVGAYVGERILNG